MADNDKQQDANNNPGRPSFTSFWKRSREALSASARRNITFVSDESVGQEGRGHGHGHDGTAAGAQEGGGSSTSTQTPQDKAKLRRAQVRKAQLQHRQRKAHYINQLEADVARIRDMISQTVHDVQVLRRENGVMRARVQRRRQERAEVQHGFDVTTAAPFAATTTITTASTATITVANVLPPLNFLPSLTADSLSSLLAMDVDEPGPLEDITLSFGFDDATNQPCYHVSSSPSSSHYESSNGQLSLHKYLPDPGPEPAVVVATAVTTSSAVEPPLKQRSTPASLSDMTPKQTQEAINFILSLEHICRAHFRQSNFQPEVAALSSRASGHTMMATTLALRTAPPQVFRAASRSQFPWGRRRRRRGGEQSMTQNTDGDEEEAADTPQREDEEDDDDGHNHDHDHEDVPVLNPAASSGGGDMGLSWQASGLTLHTLHGLASSLVPGDIEVTPVQAWFELAARHPVALLLRADILAALKRELLGVVKCPHFGAVMERAAFESVVARVLGGGWDGDGDDE
ncbi:hypothetical protein B0T26DRAFT_687321 [Lasiosphaeria miniovina]|uniref:BZIP domain-containing protein n=1 Tax=Lasiosphaeria miniovina TaxID=1954250 RepID=A0AA40EE58_9PEZI|nr:uncharacterized protein B0T26DRAFT_687321 [Lasiosphaeria miniovina]KAK0734151.1 hypothetical protein B0T26DRAFT_687321 [Lasiosphaeria miniovina]